MVTQIANVRDVSRHLRMVIAGGRALKVVKGMLLSKGLKLLDFVDGCDLNMAISAKNSLQTSV